MTKIKLNTHGTVLTGREYGKSVLKMLLEKYPSPVELDFEGVFSMGSSFGDEVVVPLAKRQGDEMVVLNASKTVKACIEDIRVETRINFIFR